MTQLGADVIKVEAPNHGDGNRGSPPFLDGEGIWHSYMNAGTRSVVADARSEGWPRLVEALASWADVVIVGNRPSSALKRGIDFASIRRHRADTVYCQITGYGLQGPWADYPAHGLQMDALAGTLPVEWSGGQPRIDPKHRSVGTTLAGIEAAVGIYAGLYRRDRTSTAQYVHVSIWESALSWMWRDLSIYGATGDQWGGYDNLGSRYRAYRAADDRAILVCPIERHFWESFCDVVQMSESARTRGDWALGMDYGAAYDDEAKEIAERIAARSSSEWLQMLRAANVPVAPILDWRDTVESGHAAENGVMAKMAYMGRTRDIPTTPVSVSSIGSDDTASIEALGELHKRKQEYVGRAPALGEHNQEVLAEIGVPEIAEMLRRDGR